MNWRELNIIQYTGATSKERVEARKLLDVERLRCYNYDREHGTDLLLKFTLEYMEGFDMSDYEVEDNVEMPATQPAPAATGRKRGRPPGKSNKAPENINILAGVEFVSVVETDVFENSQYAAIRGGSITAYSNVLAAGFPVAEELNLCPQIAKMKAALLRCGKSLSITESNGSISIKGDKLRATVQCLAEPLAAVVPDMPAISGDFDGLKAAFLAVNNVADEKAERVMHASVLLDPNTVTATNGKVLLQYWHGIANLPLGTVLPKLFTQLVSSIKYKITGLGGNFDIEAGFMRSFTVWFENGSWLKTQCYEDRWQEFSQLLDVQTQARPVYEGLFEAIDAVIPFTDGEGSPVFFGDGYVSSDRDLDAGAVYEVGTLPGGKIFAGKLIKQVSAFVKQIDITSFEDRGFFFGGTDTNPIRGVFMGMAGSR